MGRVDTWAKFVPLARRTIHDNVRGSHIYRQILLRAEIGEFLNGIHKRMIGKEVSDEYLMLELGDVCWALAQTTGSTRSDPLKWHADIFGFGWSDMYESRVQYIVEYGVYKLTDSIIKSSSKFTALLDIVGIIHWTFIGNEVTRESLQQAEKLFIEILNMNIEKLEKRYGL